MPQADTDSDGGRAWVGGGRPELLCHYITAGAHSKQPSITSH